MLLWCGDRPERSVSHVLFSVDLALRNMLYFIQRVCLLDADMLVFQNMDELLELELPEGGIAANHACCCNWSRDKWAMDEW